MKRIAPLRRPDGKSRLTVPAPKTKLCKACREPFMAYKSTRMVCSPDCAAAFAKAKREKAERAADREKRAKLKTRSDWLKEAQAQVNRYVRLRDAHLPCASCDRPASWGGQWHASHFRSVGAASAVRYSLWNIHKACSICNNHKSGNLSEYEPRLRARIGDAKVDWLRTQNQRTDYSIDYLRRLKAIFSKKANRLAKRAEGDDGLQD